MSLSAIISIDFKEVSHRDYDFLPKNYNVNATWIIKICSKFAVENYILLGKIIEHAVFLVGRRNIYFSTVFRKSWNILYLKCLK